MLARVGITVAQTNRVMRVAEIITIYLAVAAPFGVVCFWRERARSDSRLRAFAFALCAAFLFPLTALAFFNKRRRAQKFENGGDSRARSSSRDERRGQFERNSLDALRQLEQFLVNQAAFDETLRYALFAARCSVNRYAGLASAVEQMKISSSSLTARELELFRVAGRAGEDLEVAGDCLRRRNQDKLASHCKRASAELVNSLDDLREIIEARRRTASFDERSLAAATLDVYERAHELASLFSDETTVAELARLRDAERARLRYHEANAQAASSAAKNSERTDVPDFAAARARAGWYD